MRSNIILRIRKERKFQNSIQFSKSWCTDRVYVTYQHYAGKSKLLFEFDYWMPGERGEHNRFGDNKDRNFTPEQLEVHCTVYRSDWSVTNGWLHFENWGPDIIVSDRKEPNQHLIEVLTMQAVLDQEGMYSKIVQATRKFLNK